MLPAISVIMPAFNAERYVAAALRSLQTQADVDLEIVVVDDGSADGTRAIVDGVARADPRVVVLGVAHGGVSRARNAGLAAARHRLVTFLDSDDLCPPGRLSRQAARLASDPAKDVIVGELLLFEALDENFKPLPGTRSAQVLGISLSAALFRRELFDRHGNLDATLKYCEDLDFYLRLIEAETPMAFEREVAACYRRHATNTTNNLKALQRGFLSAFHKSLVRRRATGRVLPPNPIFLRRHEVEQEFRG